jgi:hypothetical protein
MLSKAPMTKQEQPKMSEEEKADLKIASSILTQSFLSPEGEQALATALGSPEPAKAVAVIISQLIEMTQTETANTPTPMNPTVWLADGGAIDNAEEDIEKVAEANGIELPEGFEEMVIDGVAELLARRSESIQQESAGAQQASQAPSGPAPMMGGMPNGMG